MACTCSTDAGFNTLQQLVAGGSSHLNFKVQQCRHYNARTINFGYDTITRRSKYTGELVPLFSVNRPNFTAPMS